MSQEFCAKHETEDATNGCNLCTIDSLLVAGKELREKAIEFSVSLNKDDKVLWEKAFQALAESASAYADARREAVAILGGDAI